MGKRNPNRNENFLDTPAFIRELAERGGFSIADTKVFMDAFQDLIADCIEQNVDINLRGLFQLYIQKIKPFTGVNAHASKLAGEIVHEDFPESKRVIIKLAMNMRDILREPSKKKIQNKKQLNTES